MRIGKPAILTGQSGTRFRDCPQGNVCDRNCTRDRRIWDISRFRTRHLHPLCAPSWGSSDMKKVVADFSRINLGHGLSSVWAWRLAGRMQADFRTYVMLGERAN